MEPCPTSGIFNATHPYPKVCLNPKHLDLNTTQIIFNLIYESVLLTGIPDWRINGTGFPTPDGCVSVTGRYWRPTWYSSGEVWTRLTNWKLPLLQLVFLTALPALSFRYKAYVLSHLLGNPIGTIQDLLLKLSSSQAPAREWIPRFEQKGDLKHIPQLLRRLKNRQRRTSIASEPIRRNGYATGVTPPSNQSIEERFAIFSNRETLWKVITIIIVSYDEFGLDRGFQVSRKIGKFLKVKDVSGSEFTEDFLEVCLHTAGALAADRYTSSLPILSALLFFVFAIATPFIQIRANGPINPGVFLNIEAYSIAFSLLFFWIGFTTMLFGIIGASQSQDRIPTVLNHFQSELRKLRCRIHDKRSEPRQPSRANTTGSDYNQRLHVVRAEEENTVVAQSKNLLALLTALDGLLVENFTLPTTEDPAHSSEDDRLVKTIPFGRIPSSQDGRWSRTASAPVHTYSPSGEFKLVYGTLGTILVFFSYAMGVWMAYLVPPEGFECRHICLTIMCALWMVSYFISLPTPSDFRRLFWFRYMKDTVVVLLLFLAIILPQCGVLNSCACYTLWSTVNMPLAQIPQVADKLYHSFKTSFAAITFCTIAGFYIIFPGLVLWHYRDAARVFLQTDNGQSNFKMLQRWRFWWNEKPSVGIPPVEIRWVFKPKSNKKKPASAK